MGKPTWHRELPYREFMRLWRWMRRQFFTASRPEGAYLYIPPDQLAGQPKQTLVRALGSQGYGPGHRFSYDKGEDVNLRNVYYIPETQDGVDWWQDHARAWIDAEGGAWLRSHKEPTPEDHPKAHLDGVGFALEPAMADMVVTLQNAGIGHERREWTRD